MTSLPGLDVTLRLFRGDDLPAVVDLYNRAAEVDQVDERYNAETFREELDVCGNPEENCFVAVTPQGRLAGYAYVEWHDDEDRLWGYAWGAVDPDLRRQGIGRRLLRAADQRFAERVAAVEVGRRGVFIQRFIQSTKPGEVALALAEGYAELRSSYRMSIVLDQPLAPATLPPGFTLRPFDVERDARAVYDVDQAAFLDGGGQPVRQTYEDWHAGHIAADHFDPALWIVAVDETSNTVAGAAFGSVWGDDHPEWQYIGRLGVLRQYRGRKLGEALLRQSFYAGQQRGYRRAVLGVRADNASALTLYERAGMQVYCKFTHYRKVLHGNPAEIQS